MKFRQAIQSIAPYQAGTRVPGSFKLSSNENPLGPSPRAMEALQKNISRVHTYPDGANTELVALLADSNDLAEDQVIVGNGSDELLLLIAGIRLDPGCNAVSTRQTFSEYRFSTAIFGAEMREVSLNPKGQFNLIAMQEACDIDTRLVFICNPNNPTGTYLSHQQIFATLDFYRRTYPEVLVVLDEAYCEYATAPDYPDTKSLLDEFPNLIVTRTFSKIYGLAGLRIGYALSSPEIILQLRKVKQPFNVNLLGQIAAVAALGDQDFVQQSQAMNQEGLSRLTSLCDELGLTYFPTQANFLCIPLANDLAFQSVPTEPGQNPAQVDPPGSIQDDTTGLPTPNAYTLPQGVPNLAALAYQVLNNHGVTVRALTSFALPSAIRITIGTPEQMDRLSQGLTSLSQRLCSLKSTGRSSHGN